MEKLNFFHILWICYQDSFFFFSQYFISSPISTWIIQKCFSITPVTQVFVPRGENVFCPKHSLVNKCPWVLLFDFKSIRIIPELCLIEVVADFIVVVFAVKMSNLPVTDPWNLVSTWHGKCMMKYCIFWLWSEHVSSPFGGHTHMNQRKV